MDKPVASVTSALDLLTRPATIAQAEYAKNVYAQRRAGVVGELKRLDIITIGGDGSNISLPVEHETGSSDSRGVSQVSLRRTPTGVIHQFCRPAVLGPHCSTALNVLTGEVIGECLPRHRHEEFLKFLRRLNREVSKNLQVHLILDNYATHKHPDV